MPIARPIRGQGRCINVNRIFSELSEPPTDDIMPIDMFPKLSGIRDDVSESSESSSDTFLDSSVPEPGHYATNAKASSHTPKASEADERRLHRILQIPVPRLRADALKTHKMLLAMRRNRFTVFDMVRTLFSCHVFNRHAARFKTSLYDEDKTATLQAILKSDQRNPSSIVDCLIPDLESQMESICKNEVFATTSPSSMETLKEKNKIPKPEILPKPDTLFPSVQEKSPDLLKLLSSLMDRKGDWKNSTELVSLLGILAFTRHKKKSNALQLKFRLYLHALGTPRHVLEMLHHMGMCCSYRVILTALKQTSKTPSKTSLEALSGQQSQHASPMGHATSNAMKQTSETTNDRSLEVLSGQQFQHAIARWAPRLQM